MHIAPRSDNCIHVSIVIVTFNKRDYIANLLKSLFEMNMSGVLCRVIVVDNASEDDTVEYLNVRFGSSIELISCKENTGGSGGFNRGIEHALIRHESPFLWLLDNDVIVKKDTLKHLLDCMMIHSSTGAVGSLMLKMEQPEIVNEAGGSVDWQRGRLIHHHHGERLSNIDPSPIPVDFCAATSLLVRRKTIEEVGVMKDFFIHFDDVEWCLRMGDAGWKIFAQPLSLIEHETFEYKPASWIRYYDTRNLLYLYDLRRAPGKRKRIRKMLMHRLYLRLMGLGRKSAQIRNGMKDYRQGRMGRKDRIMTYPLHQISYYPDYLDSVGSFHYLAPDGDKLINLLEAFDTIEKNTRLAIVYHPVDSETKKEIQRRFRVSVFARETGLLGIPKLIAMQFIRRIIFRDFTVIHHSFENRRCFPHLKRRCFVYPKAGVFIR